MCDGGRLGPGPKLTWQGRFDSRGSMARVRMFSPGLQAREEAPHDRR
jgi:hypothetical protein